MRVCGKRIRELREERGYSLQDLASKAEVSVSYLSEIERGAKKPSLKTLEKIARALNFPREQLVEAGSERGIALGDRVRLLREKRGKSLSTLAEEAGISISYLSEIERGNVYPAIDTLKKITAALDVPLSAIIGTGGSLGHKLRQAREEQGLTQADLARAAGVSAGLIGQIEQGKVQPSLKTLEKIGGVLNISPCYFIADDAGLDEVLNQMSPEVRRLLMEPKVQSVLRLVCNCTEDELRFILNFIQLYKRCH
ncbi:Cro/C1-type helix-turn-helix domain [Moorella glycerini]|uniref:Transcriptional regulator ClgR n=1 Tax=Neomoorella stamsii TaxID=1266720 RepID=A0A9X7J4T6_9FIRM|nr:MULTISPECIES: helix-turn-helix transcriptional regulator [Moorella]PRR75597.1 Transcriptional regulator ClgR [Moorella stamsii]CEP66453.1 Cro/C1-type helix-turn-helix domain [Moorella glycerini]